MSWLLAEGDPVPSFIGNSLINWIVATLIGVLVWLVKRLVDNNQNILDSMKQESTEERKIHREDIKAVMDDSYKNRIVTEQGFDKLAEAITKLSDKIRSNND